MIVSRGPLKIMKLTRERKKYEVKVNRERKKNRKCFAPNAALNCFKNKNEYSALGESFPWKAVYTSFETSIVLGIGSSFFLVVYSLAFPTHSVAYLLYVMAALLGVSGCTGLRTFYRNTTPLSAFSFVFCSVYDMVDDGETFFYLLYLIFAVLGIFVQPFFFSFHLLDLVLMSSALQNVARSVVIPRVALGMTGILGIVTIYIFSIVGFYAFHSDMQEECSSLYRCFLAYLHNGVLSGGGIGDYLSYTLEKMPSFTQDPGQFVFRLVFDLLFFICVLVLLLNIIFGIILDTFGSLREMSAEKNRLMTTQCFICNIAKSTFDDAIESIDGSSRGFQIHIKEQHNMWNYIFFLLYLRKKDSEEYTGSESHVSKCVAEEDISWIPDGKSMALVALKERVSEEKESKAKHADHMIQGDSAQLVSRVNGQLENMTELLQSLIEKLHSVEDELKQIKQQQQHQ